MLRACVLVRAVSEGGINEMFCVRVGRIGVVVVSVDCNCDCDCDCVFDCELLLLFLPPRPPEKRKK